MVFPYALIYVVLFNSISNLSLHSPEPLRAHAAIRPASADTEDQSQLQQDVNENIMRVVVDVALATDMALASSVWEMRRRHIWNQPKLAAEV